MGAAKLAVRSGIAAVVFATAAALLGWSLLAGGDSKTEAPAALGVAVLVTAGLLLVGWSRGAVLLPRLDRPAGIAAVAVVALVAWSGLSVWWSIAGDRSWDALARGVIVLSFAVVGLAIAVLPGRPMRRLALLLAALLGAVLVWAVLGKAIPALGPDDAGRVGRLKGTIGYWNALSLLADASLGLGLWLVAWRSRSHRAAGALLLYFGVIVILLTQSRAGLLAAIAVVALALVLSNSRVEQALFAVLAAVPALVVVGWAFTRPSLVEDGAARADRVADGTLLGALTLVGAAAVVLAVALVPVERLVRTRRQDVVRGLVGAGVILAVVCLLGLVAAVGNPVTWVADQVNRSGEVDNSPGRLGRFETNNRTAWWGEAWQIFLANPAGGTGAQTFEIARKRVRGDAGNVSEPHSVPLQLLSDTGLPGFVLGLVFVAGLGLGFRAALHRLEPDERAAAVGLAMLPFAFGLHALVDYDLDFVSVLAPTMLVSAALLGAARPLLRPPGGLVVPVATAVTAGVLIWVVAAPALSTRMVNAAVRQADDGDGAAAEASARRAQGFNPLSPVPVFTRADFAARSGALGTAEALYLQAARLQPENPETWYALGLFRFLTDDLCGAYYALNAAYTLDPKSSLFYRGSELDRARDAVNDTENPACG